MTTKKAREEIEKTLNVLNQAIDKLAAKKKADQTGAPDPTEELQELARFKQAELLSHVVVYAEYLDIAAERVVMVGGESSNILEKKIPVRDEDGVRRLYNVKRIKSNNSGLVGFVLYADETDNPRVHVLFRGTHNKASMRRDLETFGYGPGSITFDQNKQEIIRTIKQVVKHKQETSTQKVELNIAGHSLGGADAQMCATAVLEDVAEKPQANPLATIGVLNIMHANAAGVSYSTAKKAEQSLEIIKKRNPKFKVAQHVIHVGGDLVQQSGYTNILGKAKHKHLVETNLLRADVEPRYARIVNSILLFLGKILVVPGLKHTYVAHTTVHFHGKKQNADFKFKVFNNQRPGEDLIIQKDMKHKILATIYKSMKPSNMLKRTKRFFGFESAESKHRHNQDNPHKRRKT